jgi:hypothetical protein
VHCVFRALHMAPEGEAIGGVAERPTFELARSPSSGSDLFWTQEYFRY